MERGEDRMRLSKGTVYVAAALIVACATLPCQAQSFEPPAGPVPERAFDTTPLGHDFPSGDGRRTLAAFPKNLGRNLVGVLSRDNIAPLLFGTGLTAMGSAFDRRAEALLMGGCPSCGRTGATAGGSAMVPVVGAFFLAGRAAPQGRFRAATYDFAQAMIVNGVWTGAFKYTVRRERPDAFNSLSFPSGHTSNAFALATVAEHHYGWKVGVPAYLFATGVGLSRIESGRHYLSDVLAGATIGLVVGRTVTRLDGERPARRSRIAVGPAADAQGAGVGLNVSMSW
jgi:membrane-associated phospholipid phosphatase